MDSAVWKAQHQRYRSSGNCSEQRELLEHREHTRYGVRALVDFEWMDEGVLRMGRGLTRDISTKGMFIYSDSEPPPKADLQVKVSFHSAAEVPPNVQLRAKALVVRVEPSSDPGAPHGFAILNRSHELHNGESSIED
jgi:hypothetical protein